ncbi:PGL/p-HBAD biosynthesis glycosyltransferase [Dyadobacter sp. CECT 9623]|uniref:PGL/p-HBAD biosynthesis glycosyltransferase n=1 Tax=Dyadobacter linearis TaxID=2823330 RepID=A0ABN7R741_9BACT|nr:glycosyltransferase family 2 protein [Dyadobacter sp. CECT 9623]CAG5069895.1 PGL/p-HBAD biosynthesis glycosyltransferase [Dyadobacter sp. CECT 9623]
MHSPKISIITVVRNGEQYIENTITSVLDQTYDNIEYVIIDGNSTDGTVDIIRKYADKLHFWISEKDAGIYDAMNKGVKASTGDWLLFVNADDFLADKTSIETSLPYLQSTTHKIAYGDIIYRYPDGREKKYGVEWPVLKKRFREVAMYLAHQATFHSKSLFQERLFDTSYKIAGDYDFLLSHLKDHDATYFPVTIAVMRTGGLSYSVSKIALLKDTRKAQLKNKIYKNFPSAAWMKSALKLIVIDFVIRKIGVHGKDRVKKWLGYKTT